jgi:hypothetical protein
LLEVALIIPTVPLGFLLRISRLTTSGSKNAVEVID